MTGDDEPGKLPAPREPAEAETAKYAIEWSPAAARALRKLDKPTARRLALRVSALAVDPRPAGAKALTGASGLLRIRIGDYRVVYTVEDDQLVVLVLTLGHRRDVYRNL